MIPTAADIGRPIKFRNEDSKTRGNPWCRGRLIDLDKRSAYVRPVGHGTPIWVPLDRVRLWLGCPNRD